MNPGVYEILTRRAHHLGNLPAMPAILNILTEALSVNANKVDVDKIVTTISYDKSLAAQCLRMANSDLYRNRGDVATIRDAVLTLGLWRIRDLAFSCNLPLMFSSLSSVVPKETFWRHSLATGYVAQKLGLEFQNVVNEQLYLAGLLHDIGILINALLFPDDFRNIMEEAAREHAPVWPIEKRVLGFTHAESGRIIADLWRLPVEVADVIEYHHSPEAQPTNNEVTLIVELADKLCWKFGLGYGYSMSADPDEFANDGLQILRDKFAKASQLRIEEYISMLKAHMAAARELADRVFGIEPVGN